MHLLFETSSGFSLFETHSVEDIGKNLSEVQSEVFDLSKFGKRITLISFLPFKNATHALDNINSVANGEVSEYLKSFLELNIPISSKKASKSGAVLGVSDKNLASNIKSTLNINCISDDLVHELIRGIRFHVEKLLSQYLQADDLKRSQLGLGHAYSREKVAYNVNRSDNMIIQAIALCDQLDKDINLFSMRVKEWYSWHFPELSKLVSDNTQYAKLCLAIRQRSNINTDPTLPEKLLSIVQDPNLVKMITDAAKVSMGMEIVDSDMQNIEHFAKKLVALADYRASLGNYLHDKMDVVAPNLAALIGDTVGARLISQAGSLTNLAKFPASTVQILGAEKALFRALKTRGKTPKYGLIFHSTFIGKAGARDKGRISRFLANKCSIASRLDSFSESPDAAFGNALRKQVEQRLDFFDGGPTPPSNQEVMKMVLDQLKPVIPKEEPSISKKRKLSVESSSKKEETCDQTKNAEERDKPLKKEKSLKKGKSDKSSEKLSKKHKSGKTLEVTKPKTTLKVKNTEPPASDKDKVSPKKKEKENPQKKKRESTD